MKILDQVAMLAHQIVGTVLDLEERGRPRSKTPVIIPNLERAVKLLDDLQSLWTHPGVSDAQRERLISETFVRILIRGEELMAIEPRAIYAPLFATVVTNRRVGYGRGDWT